MDFILRCNDLKCREKLTDRAVVTTCSHIFCLRCSDALGLSTSNDGVRICPACKTALSQPDDAVVAQLNPSEDYKTSVLSGLSPVIIMECAGRGLAFYSYQAAQELLWQECHSRSLTQKHHTLNVQMDTIIQQANSEITDLRERLDAMQLDQKNQEQRNQELLEAFREKSKSHQHLHKMYLALKAQSAAAQVQAAASDDVEQILHTSRGDAFHDGLDAGGVQPHLSRFPVSARGIEQIHSRQRSGGTRGAGEAGQSRQTGNGWNRQPLDERTYTSQSNPVLGTPSQHRTRLPMPLHSSRGPGFIGVNSTAGINATPLARQPLGSLNSNAVGDNSGIGNYNFDRPNLGRSKLGRTTPRRNTYTTGNANNSIR